MVTLKDVAEAAGVSVTTVSYVLRDKGDIKAETRRRVREAARALGYRCPHHLRDQVVMFTTSMSLLKGEMVEALYQAAAEWGFDLKFKVLPKEGGGDIDIKDAHRVAGCIVSGGVWEYRVIEQLARRHPTVFLGTTVPMVPSDGVWVDNSGAVEAAVFHLAELGHRRIGLLNGPWTSATTYEKDTGLERAVSRNVAVAAIAVNAEDFNDLDGRAARSLLEHPSRPTAIIAGEASLALSVLSVCKELGMGVPGDLSVVSLRDQHSLATAGVSAFVIPYLEICRSALQRLVRRLDKPDLPGTRTHIQPSYIERTSVGPASSDT